MKNTSSFDNSNINNNQISNNLNSIKITLRKSLFNHVKTNNGKEYSNTLNNFYTKKDSSTLENKPIYNTLIKNKTNKKKIIDNNNELEENINNNNLSKIIKDINFNNLNEYYELQSSIFMKKIQKLNLKFYWTCEVLLKENNIQYPYNKLFLILFKEISLYIDEIERLNKQLKLKTKNETYYTQRISQLNEKEKSNLVNKQMIKNIQRNYNILQKANDKYKTNIEKLNKKLNYYANTNRVNKNINVNNNNINNTECKSIFGNQTMVNTTIDSLNTRNSMILNTSQNNKKIGKKIMNRKSEEINDINEIIKSGIEQCDAEIKNLSKIEELLLVKCKKKTKMLTKCNSRSKMRYNNLLNKTFK